ncbi:MAG: maleylpyruvate isomerase family mycothiol-dependent enzyme, partial [Actinomycetota bacterium]
MPIDRYAAYEATRRSLGDLVRELDQGELRTTVPACPDWSVKDALAHVVSEAEIAVTGSLPPDLDLIQALQDEEHAARREAMNARQVEARRDRTVAELLAEWDGLAEDLGPMLRGDRPFPYPFPAVDAVVVMDVALHSQDIRNAIGRPGDRDSDAVRLGMSAYAFGADNKVRMLGLPPLRLRYDGREKVIGGEGEP